MVRVFLEQALHGSGSPALPYAARAGSAMPVNPVWAAGH